MNQQSLWKQDGKNYIDGYSERGHKDIYKILSDEIEAVQYVLNQISEGQVDNSHLVAWTWNNNEIDAAESELQALFIPFERNDIPNFDSDGRTAYRIFVEGKNIQYLTDFKKKYRCDLSSNQQLYVNMKRKVEVAKIILFYKYQFLKNTMN